MGFELDQLADHDDHEAENVFCDGSSTAAVEPYKPKAGFKVLPPPPAASNQHLKGQKIAYKFETDWMQGTYRGPYKGKKDEYKGHFAIYFDRKTSYYLELNIDKYGCDKDWVIFGKV